MAELKSLAKDTAIYGASSIIGKFLNYFLVPIYTFSLPAASGGSGAGDLRRTDCTEFGSGQERERCSRI